MSTTTTDDRGRIVIPAEFREKYGDRYRIVELRDSLRLIPIDDDPIDGYRDAVGDAFEGTSIDEIKREARSDAADQGVEDRARGE